MKIRKTTTYFIKAAATLIVLSVCIPSTAQQITSQEFFEQLTIILKSPQNRARLKQVIGNWTPEQKVEFSKSLSSKAMESTGSQLPMQIDKDTTWRSLRFSSTGIYSEVVLSDEASSDPSYLSDNKEYFKNYMCTTPANALLMIIGYRVYISYYDTSSRFIEQLQYAIEDCEAQLG